MSHYSKCMVIKVHFSHFVCVSGVAFLRLTVVLGKKDEPLVNSHIGAGLDSSLSNSMDQCNFIHVTFAHRDDYVRCNDE